MGQSDQNGGIRIVIIKGSVRPGNYTAMAAELVADEIRKHPDIALDVIDPAELNLQPPGVESNDAEVTGFVETVSRATGVIFATPEYHGSFSSVMKLAIENLGFPSVLSGKPVALLGVAAGAIGAIKSLEQLRGVCSHVGAIVLPGSVSVAGVQSVFDEGGHCLDENTERRIRQVGTNLIEYIQGNICPRIALEEMVRGTAE
ncbi:MAG: NAD(P)H-dependent oxidoreductase [Pseudomonadales bacterium]|jgi:NAD(P)H-dependent FMN reductase|nr:NAD(P)H-dependent oxidoreductase [Pseudomonadales bacterium]HJN51324.1 NAD(P)H-dependent oxidoreductase [Pseudomonadales bacterium]|tara:strand:- start:9699 stop:10304 length:606 start_codon:yes stop_codon:yes gene_type:complete